MKQFLFVLIFGSAFCLGSAHADDFVTQDEIEKSTLNDTEKAFALATLRLKPVIECVSSNEGIGADNERLRIYFLEIGNVFKASFALWKTDGKIKNVFGAYHDVEMLTEAYAKNSTLEFDQITDTLAGKGLEVTFGQIVPLVGKVTSLSFAQSGKVAQQICKVSAK